MALKQSAPIGVRAFKAWTVAAVAGALVATTGCNHRRSALRPVFSAPRAVAAPCTNCGDGGSAVVADPGATIIRGGAALDGAPTVSEPGGAIPSDVPPLDEPLIDRTPTSRSSSRPETPPKATIGDPYLDELPDAAPTSRSRSLKPSYDSKAKSNTKASPLLQGPEASSSTSPSTSSSNLYRTKVDGGLRSTSATGVVRRTSGQETLKSFFGEAGGDELFFPNKADRPWKYVVLHHSATPTGSYDTIDAEHRKVLGFDGCGYHFVIGNGTGSGDGQIEVSQRWVNQKHGVHCRNARKSEIDEYGIGICFIGDFNNAPPTARQVAAARSLIAYLSRKYEIADDNVETHAHLAATPTVCPGKHFPFESVTAAPDRTVQQEARPARSVRPVPTAWKVRTPSRPSDAPVY